MDRLEDAAASDARLDEFLPDTSWPLITALGINCWRWDVPREFLPKEETHTVVYPHFVPPLGRLPLFWGLVRRIGPQVTALDCFRMLPFTPLLQLREDKHRWVFPHLHDRMVWTDLPKFLPNLKHVTVYDHFADSDELFEFLENAPHLASLASEGGVRLPFKGMPEHPGLRYVALPPCSTEEAISDIEALMERCKNLECIDITRLGVQGLEDFWKFRCHSHPRLTIIDGLFSRQGAASPKHRINLLGDIDEQVDAAQEDENTHDDTDVEMTTYTEAQLRERRLKEAILNGAVIEIDSDDDDADSERPPDAATRARLDTVAVQRQRGPRDVHKY